MGLLDIFKRKTEASPDGAPAPDAVASARARARRRLIGATVLLAAGIIGFPLLFETQPRPIPVDVPIEIPQKDKAPPLVLSSAPGASTVAAVPQEPPPDKPDRPDKAAEPSRTPEVITERASEQGREVAPKAGVADTPVVAPVPVPMPTPAAAKPSAPTPAASKPAPKPVEHTADKSVEANRAQALLDGKPASAPASTRVVVQVGAYTDATKLREARAKVEKLGMKSYTQVVDGEAGHRTRVRVGPFASKAEADKAAAKLRAAGLPAAILTL